MDSETATELDGYIQQWKEDAIAALERDAHEAEVADGLQSDPAYEEWAEAMRASDAGAWDEA